MRTVLRDITKRGEYIPDHAGLAYDVWAPIEGNTGKVADKDRDQWLTNIASLSISADYLSAYNRWHASFARDDSRTQEMKLTSRLLVGHGNASPTEVGLTLHRTWGVPVIPGSALKGLLAHYVDAVYGPDRAGRSPADPDLDADARDRARFQGVTWQNRHIVYGPGEIYRALFGAPDADDDRSSGQAAIATGASQGLVVFHDALFVPGRELDSEPLAADVLTVHQRSYYEGRGAQSPNDYDSPIPVAFLTVRPGAHFLLALSGPADWTELAMELLGQALMEWGIGAKTSQGYGRAMPNGFRKNRVSPSSHQNSELFASFLEWMEDPIGQNGQSLQQREMLEYIRSEWLERLRGLTPHERKQAAGAVRKRIRTPKAKEQLAQLLADLGQDDATNS